MGSMTRARTATGLTQNEYKLFASSVQQLEKALATIARAKSQGASAAKLKVHEQEATRWFNTGRPLAVRLNALGTLSYKHKKLFKLIDVGRGASTSKAETAAKIAGGTFAPSGASTLPTELAQQTMITSDVVLPDVTGVSSVAPVTVPELQEALAIQGGAPAPSGINPLVLFGGLAAVGGGVWYFLRRRGAR